MKTRPGAPKGFFAAEAAGLRWLGEQDSVLTPGVLAVSDTCLILEWVEPTRPTADLAADFGRRLARMHLQGAAGFGADRDGFIGILPLPNKPAANWLEFYAVRRVLPYLKLAADRGNITIEDASVIERSISRFTTAAGPEEPISRIHGDLWAGNLVWGSEQVVLIDPAAHGGHRETDLALLALFGAPFLERIQEGYQEVSPLAEGWEERQGLHQLHPLLVHAALFGGEYGARAARLAQRL
ncbi:MAG TPA: fructosamine kinase family protein [Marmoricola sp.]|nr:fructosamine kinase family protein [Marmoricola sp.]